MKLGTDLKPLTIEYPKPEDMPQNLLNGKKNNNHNFNPTSKRMAVLEQFNSEKKPHRVSHLDFQYGKIDGKRATMLFLNRKPYRLVYSDQKDPFLDSLLKEFPPNHNFPPNAAPTHIARMLREFGLKWVAEKYFNSLEYMVFDEPRLYTVNPDLLAIPHTQASKIIRFTNDYREADESGNQKNQADSNNQNKNNQFNSSVINIQDTCFVEIKAYHRITAIGEKEILQAFNYSILGGKTLLLSTGHLDELDSFDILNKASHKHEKTEEGYDKKTYKKFVKAVGDKYHKKVRELDMRKGQDQYDTRGIYYSAKSKLKKMYKYTKNWPNKVEFEVLDTPLKILNFLQSETKLGIIDPLAFLDALKNRRLKTAASLYKNVGAKYIEQIALDPTNLYPK